MRTPKAPCLIVEHSVIAVLKWEKFWILFYSCNLSLLTQTLHEKCPYLGFFWSVFIPNAGKYGPGKLRIWKLFTQSNYLCKSHLFRNFRWYIKESTILLFLPSTLCKAFSKCKSILMHFVFVLGTRLWINFSLLILSDCYLIYCYLLLIHCKTHLFWKF